MTIQVRCGSATHVGCVRSSNQDSVLAGPTVYAVADGMGGHVGGEVASTLAVDALATVAPSPSVDQLLEAVHHANDRILREAEPGSGKEGMGTTVTGVALGRQDEHDLVVIFNVGDSRTYRCTGPAMTQITVDHSLVAEMVRDGEIAPEEAAVHPSRNVVTRALGIDGPLEVDLWTDRPSVGTTYLMCSDGLFNEVSDDELAEVLFADGSPQEKADALMAHALDAGAHDNVSVLVATIDDAGDVPGPAEDTNPNGVPAIGGAPDEDTNPRERG